MTQLNQHAMAQKCKSTIKIWCVWFAAPAIGWRWPFIIVAIPAICMAFLMLFTVPEPPRGVTEDAIQVLQKS